MVRLTATYFASLKSERQFLLEGRVGSVNQFSPIDSVPTVVFLAVEGRRQFALERVDSSNLEFVSRKIGARVNKFTPGPWTAIISGDFYWIRHNQSKKPFCLVSKSGTRISEENTANAALAVDAPMFHEALSALVRSIGTDNEADLAEALEKAKNLLEKHP